MKRAYSSIRRLPRDRTEWKWVVISLHGALYSFAICAIKGTDWNHVTTRPGVRRLIAFDEAIKRCQSDQWMRQFTHSRPLRLTTEQRDAIRFLKRIRNQIEHYVPLDWGIEEHDLTVTAIDALEVVRQLALDTGNVQLDPPERQVVDDCTRKGKKTLQPTQLYKDYVAAIRRHSVASSS